MLVTKFILLVVITHTIDAQLPSLVSTDRLPGLDEIESGFNVVSMISISDKESKFRLFDLNEKGLYPFRLTANNIDRIYNTPLYGQVTKIGLRRDINCESISTDFRQFYSNYFQSTRTSSGWAIPFFAQTSNKHETLKRIYEAITKNSQAIGTSTSWWGLYSIQLGPPYILKLDPMFNTSMSTLARISSNPTSESDQSLYNMLIETYGTHYVTHVIVGATAHIYTCMNESYSKTSSYEEITRQVSNTGSYFFIQIGDASYMHSILQNVSESFRKNTNSLSLYQPPVTQVIGKTEWQSWLANAPQNPVVVNRTLAPITNLFYAYPNVQSYLRRTVDYYVNYGILPTFAQLNTK